MIHYFCDRCKRKLDPRDDVRYVVQLEAYPALDAAADSTEMEDDRDYLAEIQDALQRAEDCAADCVFDELYKRHQYDLCADCFKQFVENPLGREPAVQLDFSHN